MILYGSAASQACRSLWMLEELGVAYHHDPIVPHKETRTLDFLALNPNGHVPVLDDNGFILWEAAAINFYLAEKAGAHWWPASPKDRADIYRWSFWLATEAQPALRALALARARGDEVRAEQAAARSVGVLSVLDHHLADRAYLLGDTFGVADINVVSALRHPHECGPLFDFAEFDMSPIPRVHDYITRCSARPANRRTAALAL